MHIQTVLYTFGHKTCKVTRFFPFMSFLTPEKHQKTEIPVGCGWRTFCAESHEHCKTAVAILGTGDDVCVLIKALHLSELQSLSNFKVFHGGGKTRN